jgi:hypothetical protein
MGVCEQVVETKKGFSKKPIIQVRVLGDKNLLISLTDIVSISTLGDGFAEVTSLAKTRGAT